MKEARGKKNHDSKYYLKKILEVPGVKIVPLSSLEQKFIGAVVGKDVTSEHPWILVRKELIQDHIDLHEESSHFLSIKVALSTYPEELVLCYYVLREEESDFQEFLLCTTKKSKDFVSIVIDKQQKHQQRAINRSMFKTAHKWKSQGTAKEIAAEKSRPNRNLLEVEIESIYPIVWQNNDRFSLMKVDHFRDSYQELQTSSDQLLDSIQKKRVHKALQVNNYITSKSLQAFYFPAQNTSTQYEFLLPELILSPDEIARVGSSIKKFLQGNNNCLKVNEEINLYELDYHKLSDIGKTILSKSLPLGGNYSTFIDAVPGNNKMISAMCCHPTWSGIIAVAYVNQSSRLNLRTIERKDEVRSIVHGMHQILIWSFNDNLYPKLILESQREVTSLSFCPYNEALLVGGCSNGQVSLWDITRKIDEVEEEEILNMDQQKYRSILWSKMNWYRNVHDKSRIRTTASSNIENSQVDAIVGIEWLSCFHEISKTGKIMRLNNRRSLQFCTASADGTVAFWDLDEDTTEQRRDVNENKPKKKTRKTKRPAKLEATISPFRKLHLALRPKYKTKVKELLAPEESSKTSDKNELQGQYYPFATVLRLRVLQIVCGISFLITGTVAFIEEKGKMNLALAIPAGVATILAAAASIHTSKGFSGYHHSTCNPRLRFLGPTIALAVPLTLLWTTSLSFLTLLILQSTRILSQLRISHQEVLQMPGTAERGLHIEDGHLSSGNQLPTGASHLFSDDGYQPAPARGLLPLEEDAAKDLTILALVELSLAVVTWIAVLLLLRIDCKYDPD